MDPAIHTRLSKRRLQADHDQLADLYDIKGAQPDPEPTKLPLPARRGPLFRLSLSRRTNATKWLTGRRTVAANALGFEGHRRAAAVTTSTDAA